jgi:hypothetical protein
MAARQSWPRAAGFVVVQQQQQQQRFKTITAEVCAESPVITRVSALFIVQALLLLAYVALAVCTSLAVSLTNNDWFKDAVLYWSLAYLVLNVAHVAIYDTWISSCHVLTSKAETRLVIGRPMHLAMQKGLVASAAVFSGIAGAVFTLVIETDRMRKPLEHSATSGTLYFLVLLSRLGIAVMIASLSQQFYPRINVSQVIAIIHGSAN